MRLYIDHWTLGLDLLYLLYRCMIDARTRPTFREILHPDSKWIRISFLPPVSLPNLTMRLKA